MKKVLISLVSLLVISCSNKPSLEKYYVENAENKNFVQLDISPSILNMNKAKLTPDQIKAMQTFEKVNVLAFKINDKNKALFATERTKVNTILKDEKYQQLMKFGSGKDAAMISFVGPDDHISEFVVYGSKEEFGFVIVRILGKDMSPSSILTIMESLKTANVDMAQLKPLLEQFKN